MSRRHRPSASGSRPRQPACRRSPARRPWYERRPRDGLLTVPQGNRSRSAGPTAADRLPVLHDLIRAHPLAVLVTLDADGLVANHIPMEIDAQAGELGTLRGHVARANPMWTSHRREVEAMAVFQGPAGYITPAYYATKAETGKVVPTWNYATVHAYGPLRTIEDAAWLRRLVEQLTDRHEAERARADGEPPWKVSDAPAAYIDGLLKAIVGIELPLTRMEGKWKVSQNRPPEDRAGVVASGASGIQTIHLVLP